MKKFILIILTVAVFTPACNNEDVFAPWRDPSKYVIPSDETYFTVVQYNIWGAKKIGSTRLNSSHLN